jgi:hypothetical protein
MIYPVTMYAGKCDNCGHDIILAGGEFSAYGEREGVEEEMRDSDWLIGDGKDVQEGYHICPDCYFYNDDDHLMIKTQTTNNATTGK